MTTSQPKWHRVHDFDEFRALVASGQTEFAISLAGGALISRKQVWPTAIGGYEVFHGIDGRFEMLSEAELLSETNIGRALEVGALFAEQEKSGGEEPVALSIS